MLASAVRPVGQQLRPIQQPSDDFGREKLFQFSGSLPQFRRQELSRARSSTLLTGLVK